MLILGISPALIPFYSFKAKFPQIMYTQVGGLCTLLMPVRLLGYFKAYVFPSLCCRVYCFFKRFRSPRIFEKKWKNTTIFLGEKMKKKNWVDPIYFLSMSSLLKNGSFFLLFLNKKKILSFINLVRQSTCTLSGFIPLICANITRLEQNCGNFG